MSRRKQKYRILVVDDHPIFRRGIAQLLENEQDLTVTCEADTAQEAMTVTAEVEFDLAIVDIALKGTNGIELLKSLRSRFPRLLV
jgi:DNA-binding NarL/FixJ family response regulator